MGVEVDAPLALYALRDGRGGDELLFLHGVLNAPAVRDRYDGGDEHLPLRALLSFRYGIVVQVDHALLGLQSGADGHVRVLVDGDGRRER